MFSNLLYIIFVLLVISISLGAGNLLGLAPEQAWMMGMTLYAVTLALIVGQNVLFKRKLHRKKELLLLVTNGELLIFLSVYHFILGGQQFFETHLGMWQAPGLLFSLLLYLFGLGVFHYTSYDPSRAHPSEEIHTRFYYALLQLRMVIPFVLPFALFTLLLDIAKYLPVSSLQEVLVENKDNATGSLILLGGTIAYLIGVMVVMPAFIQWVWLCKPLEEGELRERLERLCDKARFKHAGMQTWTVMNNALTAAIVGVTPRFRYVMFTRRLLRSLSGDAIEAILAHEIGHSYRRHLLIYPLIFFGMMLTTGIASLLLAEPLAQYFTYKNVSFPSPWWSVTYVFALFLIDIVIIGLYFRYVFGFFSRQFERQADLHVLVLGLPISHMVEALTDVAMASGQARTQPSWHHYSIQQRIDFLNDVQKDPTLAEAHHRKVKVLLLAYALLAGITTGILLYYLS